MFKVYDLPTFDSVHDFCQYFREDVLKITLKDMSKKTGVKFGTISAFEKGRSHNLTHLYKYMSLCDTRQLKDIFKQGIGDTLENVAMPETTPIMVKIISEGRDNV